MSATVTDEPCPICDEPKTEHPIIDNVNNVACYGPEAWW